MRIPFDPPPGFNEDDSPFAAEGQWKTGDGWRFVRGRAETIGGAVQMTSATGVSNVNKMLVYDAAGTIKIAVAGATLHIAAPNTAGTDITPVAGWSGGTTRHCLAMYGDVLLALVSGGKLFESSAGAQAVAVTNAPTQSTVMLVTPSRQVMLLGTQEEGSGTFNGRCIRWSDVEDRTTWATAAANNAGEYILPGQEDIVAATVFGDHILIWTEGSLWLCQFVGDPGQTFSFTRVDGIGICGLDAFAIYRQTAYWISADFGFFAYQLLGLPQRIPCPIQRYFRDSIATISAANMAQSFGCANSRFGEVWFGIPTFTALPDQYFTYCVDETVAAQRPVWFYGSFAIGTLNTNVTTMVESALPWDASRTYGTQILAHTNIGGKPWRWDCSVVSPAMAFGFSYIETNSFYLDESERRIQVQRFIPDWETASGTPLLTVYTKENPNSSEVTNGSYSVSSSATKLDFRASGKIARVKISNGSGATRIRLGKPLFDAVVLGKR